MDLSDVWRSLIATGPTAAILGLVCWTLWKQNVSLQEKDDRRQDQMLRLAVRVQRAVEALAGIDHDSTEVDEVLGGRGDPP